MSNVEGAQDPLRGGMRLGGVFVTGLAWTLGSFGGLRLIGIAQTLVLARLLSPADFGAYAMASLSVSLGAVFSSLGTAQAVIQSRLDTRATLDTAFCLNLLRGFLLYLVLFLAAPFIERFYATAGVSTWIRVLALTIVLDSAGNVGMLLFSKQLDYRRASLYGQLPVLVSTVTALGFAIWIRSAWALVLSQVAASLVQLPFSYWAHPYRPRLRVEAAALRHLLDYGRYVLGSAPLFYLSSHIDEIAIGRRFGSRSMGAYQLSYNAAALPATYLAELVSGVLFPVFAHLQSAPTALREAYLKTVRHLANLCLPISVSLLVFAQEYIRLLYGSRWEEAIPILRAFCVYGAIRPLAGVSIQVFRATGQTQALLRVAVLNLVGVSWMVFVGISYGPIWVARLLSILSLPAIIYGWELTATALDLKTSVILRACAPAVVASGISLAVTLLVGAPFAAIDNVVLRLGTGLALLGAVYVPVLLLLDRRWASEIGELLRARRPHLAGSP